MNRYLMRIAPKIPLIWKRLSMAVLSHKDIT
jgi:hypothetical protein